MRLRKLGVLGLSAVCLLACGGKTVSAADAKKFVEENYSSKKVKTIKSINLSYDCSKTQGDAYKIVAEMALLALAEELGVSYSKDSYKIEVELKSGDKGFATYSAPHNWILDKDNGVFDQESAVFTVNGKELTINAADKNESSNYVKTVFNENGQCKQYELGIKTTTISGAEGYFQSIQKQTVTFSD